jgi:hypothetical protein
MANYKPDPEFGPGSHVEDLTPIPRHEFTEANGLHLFPFDEDALPRLDCPDDCGAFCEPASVGEAVDWALGHKCLPEWEAAPAAAGED